MPTKPNPNVEYARQHARKSPIYGLTSPQAHRVADFVFEAYNEGYEAGKAARA